MKGFQQLKIQVEELLRKYNELQGKHDQLREKYERVKKDYDYLISQNRDMPEVIKKNKKLNEQRREVKTKIDSILSRIEEINI